MRFNHKQLGQLVVQSTYMENIKLRRGGTISLYWAKGTSEFAALIVRRVSGKTLLSQVLTSWEIAKRVFTSRIIREGLMNMKKPRNFHSLNLYFAPDTLSDQWRCIAICKEGRKFVDVLHISKIGCLALAFQGMKKECGCKHRKRYEELDYHTFRELQGTHLQERVSQSTSI